MRVPGDERKIDFFRNIILTKDFQKYKVPVIFGHQVKKYDPNLKHKNSDIESLPHSFFVKIFQGGKTLVALRSFSMYTEKSVEKEVCTYQVEGQAGELPD